MEELFNVFINDLDTVKRIIDFVKKEVKENEVSEQMVTSMMCMMFDELFEERSVEVAEMCLDAIKEINADLGTWDAEKQMNVK